jgi:hypothetical protein
LRWAAFATLLVVVASTVAWWHGRAPSAPAAPAATVAPARPAIDGAWHADVTYDWPNSRRAERFAFRGDGAELQGSASFLGVDRGILEGRVEGDAVSFVTRTQEATGTATLETVHRYRGRLVGDELRLVMQTEGGATPHVPVEFVAKREPAR